MIIILHGENIVKSRQKLVEIIDQKKQVKSEIIRVESKNISIPELEEKLGGASLFGFPQLLVIEELHSLPKSKRKDELINLIANFGNQDNLDVVLWEKRDLTPTMLKKLAPKTEINYKLTNQLFSWLDSISPNPETKKRQLELLSSALENNGEMMCFIMLIRQIRLLIQAKDGGNIKGPPFVISKLKKQATFFNLNQLIQIHQKMLKIDINQKHSTNLLNLRGELDLLIISM